MRLSTYVFGVPAVVIAGALAIANRQSVVFSLDPFSSDHPALAFSLPLYLLMFFALALGIVLGGATQALSRLWGGRARKPLPPVRGGPKSGPG